MQPIHHNDHDAGQDGVLKGARRAGNAPAYGQATGRIGEHGRKDFVNRTDPEFCLVQKQGKHQQENQHKHARCGDVHTPAVDQVAANQVGANQ